MKIYNEDKHEDELYKYFNTFGEYVNTVSDEKKDILVTLYFRILNWYYNLFNYFKLSKIN